MYKTCHTEASSRRQRTLEQGLLKAMETQPYAKITLTELCTRLGIPRKSFYRYFPTKEDCLLSLLDHTLTDCNDIALKGWNGTRELTRAHLLQFFLFWQAQTSLLDAVRDNDFSALLLDRTTAFVDRMKESGDEAGFARSQVEYFIAHGLMATVLRWHRHGFPSTPEEMAEVFGQVLHSQDVSISRLIL